MVVFRGSGANKQKILTWSDYYKEVRDSKLPPGLQGHSEKPLPALAHK